MKLIVLFCLLILPLITIADFVSPFRSSIDEISIPNAHIIANDPKSDRGLVIRGMAPVQDGAVEELINYGIEEILIFKNQTREEIDKEVDELFKAKFPMDNIHHIPFKWKDFYNFEVPCIQTIKALRILRHAYKQKKPIFFHCTVGEDRTGFLAGVFRYLLNPRQDINQLFKKELCERGYAAGNPEKPDFVVNAIRDGISPLFTKFLYKIDSKAISFKNLNYETCSEDPAEDHNFTNAKRYNLAKFICERP